MTYAGRASAGSEAPKNMCQIMTLSSVLEVVKSSPALPERRRKEMLSALMTVERLSRRPLTGVAADVKTVRELLDTLHPARARISQGRWANVRSLTMRAMDIAGVTRLPGRTKGPIAPAWKELLAPLPYRPLQVALLTLAHYCSERGIGPHQADQALFEQFERDLVARSGRSRPRATYLDTVRAWNKAASIYGHWPDLRVTVEHQRDHYSLAWNTFPPSLKADIDAMCAAALSPDPFEPTSRRPIKAVSADNRRSLLRAYASALVHSGCRPSDITNIAALLSLERAKLGLSFVHERLGKRKTVHLHQMAKLLCTLGKYWANLPEQQLDALNQLRRQLDPRSYGMTTKNRTTLREFEDPHVVEALLALPERIWQRHNWKSGRLTQSAAVDLQVALAIELLIAAPVRCKNLVATEIGKNLIEVGSGTGKTLHLHYPKEDVKNDMPLEFALRGPTTSLIDRYTKFVRPRLLRAPSSYLFPGETQSHKGGALLSEQVADLVEREIGVRLTVHQFRHLAGFVYLRANPGGHEVVRRLLGHKTIATTISFYAGMEVREAVRHYDHLIERTRVGAKLKAGGARA